MEQMWWTAWPEGSAVKKGPSLSGWRCGKLVVTWAVGGDCREGEDSVWHAHIATRVIMFAGMEI